MPLILMKPNKSGRRDIIIILQQENLDRIKEKDPFMLDYKDLPTQDPVGVIVVAYLTDTEMMQATQLARQGKTVEAIELATSGFKYRPELGDHDRGPERLT